MRFYNFHDGKCGDEEDSKGPHHPSARDRAIWHVLQRFVFDHGVDEDDQESHRTNEEPAQLPIKPYFNSQNKKMRAEWIEFKKVKEAEWNSMPLWRKLL